MTQPKYAYKVVSADGQGNLNSLVVDSRNVRVRYVPGKWAKPQIKGSLLMVFTGRRRAMNFSAGWHSQVWHCEVRGLRRLDRVAEHWKPKAFVQFWQEKVRILKTVVQFLNGSRAAPRGTYGAEQVKLLEKIT